MPYSEAKDEYMSLLESHISEEMRAATDIMTLMKSEEALKVFLPVAWTGLNGIEPILLKTLPSMPTKIKPPARPINPKLYENAKKEFERLRTYFYREGTLTSLTSVSYAPTTTITITIAIACREGTLTSLTSVSYAPTMRIGLSDCELLVLGTRGHRAVPEVLRRLQPYHESTHGHRALPDTERAPITGKDCPFSPFLRF
jgi:hypothetical protein